MINKILLFIIVIIILYYIIKLLRKEKILTNNIIYPITNIGNPDDYVNTEEQKIIQSYDPLKDHEINVHNNNIDYIGQCCRKKN